MKKKPLDMAAVYIYLEKAVQQVNKVHEKSPRIDRAYVFGRKR
ncbi:hypothetical protein RCO48_07515 [Peribacillus frigoritolerans]|nr:hypothetical protein [Peribacillus frigoritolerans]